MARRGTRSLVATIAVTLVVASCSGGTGSGGPRSSGTGGISIVPLDAVSTMPDFPLCGQHGDLPTPTAPEAAYGEASGFLVDPVPDALRTWARDQEGFEELWIDHAHKGWLTLGLSEGVEERQADLERLFPEEPVVAVSVEYTRKELRQLRARVEAAFEGRTESSDMSVATGTVWITVPVVTDEMVAEVRASFPGEPVCLEGNDPKDVPAPGPQGGAGDGWRLLLDEPGVGEVFATEIAIDQQGLRELWNALGTDAPLPHVDFATEVVIWFGAVYPSSCPDLRLDDVEIDGDTVHARIVDPAGHYVCTADANPHAFVVAVDRTRLPSGPFGVQLSEKLMDGEMRTMVDEDLSRG